MNAPASATIDWPDIPYEQWRETATFLHLASQIVGKYRLAHTPWLNHSWHATLYVTPPGLTTGPVADGNAFISLSLDFHDHVVIAEAGDGARASFPLKPMSIAAFYQSASEIVTTVGGSFNIHGSPNEVVDPIPFSSDLSDRPYDADAVSRFHQALARIAPIFDRFRTGFLGKVSPTHLFWGSFDLAVTRFSGRTAPLHPGGFPALPDSVTQEAYSHEVFSAGFWPGGNGADEAMFYAYAYPTPEGFNAGKVRPAAATFDSALGEFLLPYAAVRESATPEADVMAFLTSTYEAAAETGKWDRAALECPTGTPRIPRSLG
ncbi:MAG: DUF5996 family protein [Pseudomonadota bacterium]